ncbi:MAG: pentapeptide repeat-containing protein [Ktedonobacteraceae bacterium]
MSKAPPSLQRPNTDDDRAWHAYWEVQDQPWRTEPEIDSERQQYLHEHLTVKEREWERYPFMDSVLNRADVEWLLATYADGRGFAAQDYQLLQKRNGLDLRGADLRKIDLHGLPMKGVDLYNAHLEGTDLREVHLERANLSAAYLQDAYLYNAHLEDAYLSEAHLEGADLRAARLEGADLSEAYLERADLSEAHLERTDLKGAHLEQVGLRAAHLEGTDLNGAHLEGSNLSGAFFTSVTNLRGVHLGDEKSGFVLFAGVRCGDVDLSVVDWAQMNILGDEYQARRREKDNGEAKDSTTRLEEYRTAVRANRQLAVALRGEGLNEEAARYAYRAQRLQRVVLRRQRKPGQYLFSLFLDLLVGYGYRPGRSLFWYLGVIFGFAITFFAFGHLTPLEAFIFSLTSFHGRGFFPGSTLYLNDTRVILAAFEAVVGLLIEASLIATFTQRFIGK